MPFLELTRDWGLRLPSVPQSNCENCGGPEEVLDIDSSDDVFRAVMCSDGGEMTESAHFASRARM